MNYKIRTLRKAKRNLEGIIRYITEKLHDPQAATSLLNAIEKEITSLDTMPKRHALVSDKRLAKQGIRQIPVKNYTIFYAVNDQTSTVNIISVMYSKRDWANVL
jgi:toxin ParE1/3/4